MPNMSHIWKRLEEDIEKIDRFQHPKKYLKIDRIKKLEQLERQERLNNIKKFFCFWRSN